MDDSSVINAGALRAILAEAEAASRRAADALIDTLIASVEQARRPVAILREYCRACPDAALALDIARVIRGLLCGPDPEDDRRLEPVESARLEVRLQWRAMRLACLLRDLGEVGAEQALVDLAVIRLQEVENHPRYPQILSEMGRLLDGAQFPRPVALMEEVFGVARGAARLAVESRWGLEAS